ncbi:MAG: glucose-6-phosphate isomerase [Candidatus Altimarinota bacterium]
MKYIQVQIEDIFINDFLNYKKEILSQDQKLLDKTGAGNDFLGWFDVENIISKEEIEKIKNTAKKFQNFEKVVVIGIGGSYLGAKSVLEALQPNFIEEKIIFAGYQLDSLYLKNLLDYLDDKNYAIVIISKSGTTLEPALSFRMLVSHLQKKYSKEEVSKRVIAITDKNKGVLKNLATKNGFLTFVIPDDVGGRYSVFTPVGLLPIAIAGYDIDQILKGASEMQKYLDEEKDILKNPAFLYAGIRNILLQKGKNIEILASFHFSLKYISEWWKQLFGESEGKDGKGIFPTSLNFSTDLHSLGQYVQDGKRNLFETFLVVENEKNNLEIPYVENDNDRLNFLAGKNLSFVNTSALEGTIQAHREGGVSVIKILIPEINEYYLGQLLYFFQRSCGISAYLLGVNPFNQPGVEAYKKHMMENLR